MERRRESVMDYVLRDERTRERVERLVVDERVDSDHQLITVSIKGSKKEKRGKKGGEKE